MNPSPVVIGMLKVKTGVLSIAVSGAGARADVAGCYSIEAVEADAVAGVAAESNALLYEMTPFTRMPSSSALAIKHSAARFLEISLRP